LQPDAFLRSIPSLMVGLFILGLLLGAGAVWFVYLAARRENIRINHDRQLLRQEKLIVVEFMHNLVETIGEGADRQELFQRVVHAAILSTNSLSACVFEIGEDKTVRGVAVEGLFPPLSDLPQKVSDKLATRVKFIERVLKSEAFALGEGLIGAVAKTGESVLIEDARTDPRVVQHSEPALPLRSLIAVPLRFRKNIIGVLAVANPSDGSAFTQTDFSLVESLAEQAAMAIYNADLMRVQIEKNRLDFDISMASTVQALLLPRQFPDCEQLDIDAYYRPAQKVGGDLYDVFELDDGKIGLVVADVSGKGITASLLMAIAQTHLRHFSRMYDSPAEVLRQLNREIGHELRQDMFVTFLYGLIDVAEGTLTLSRAGHELPLLLHRNSAQGEVFVEPVHSEGMAVGMVPCELFDRVIEDKTVPFGRHDLIVFYTDGITEATSPEGVEFSAHRLSDTMRTLRERDAQKINAGIVAAVERFTGSNDYADDLTLITVRHT